MSDLCTVASLDRRIKQADEYVGTTSVVHVEIVFHIRQCSVLLGVLDHEKT